MSWQLPDEARISIIKDDQHLDTLDLESSVLCAIDAEWPPEQTYSQSPPSATLIQLAFWSPLTGITVVLLDLLALSPSALHAFLRPLFRRPTLLKVGYAIKADMLAIARALGPHGSSCLVMTPALDFAYLDWAVEKRQSGVSGLSSLIHTVLGKPLDKTLQCSAWGQRPLSEKQIRYAATDACCLLFVLDHMIHDTLKANEKIGDQQEATGSGGEKEPLTASGHFDSSLTHCSTDQINSLIEDLGIRLDFSTGGGGPSRQKLKGKTSTSSATSNTKKGKAKAKGRVVVEALALPSKIPWMDDQGEIISEPRFLADVMTGGLARQLRLWGFDAESVEPQPKTERHVVYRTLVDRAQAEGRIILTRDAIFINRNLSDQACFIVHENKQDQLREVVEAFQLNVEEEALLSRCAKCNGEFLPEPIPAEKLPEGHGVAEGVLARGLEFWVCRRCGSVYWQGNMYDRAMERLSAAVATLKVN